MAGDDRIDQLVSYLSRLTGETLGPDHPVLIRSVHRAALAAWARKQNLPIAFGLLASGAPVPIRALLAGAAVDPASAPLLASFQARAAPVTANAVVAGGVIGIGIDIEEVAALPETHDYREHSFYQDNFTVGEIAYCIRQADARASFSGVWAAKEAVLKSGLATAPDSRFKGIEIGRDVRGRPVFPGAQLSISHTATTAVAVCIAHAPTIAYTPVSAAPVFAALTSANVSTSPAPAGQFRPLLGIGVAAGAVLVVAGSVLSLALHLWH